ncbi:MAG: tripartite tricarboxylate transporter permease [Desulfobacteraceae bacterium]|nr:MAG: tripartite tricarboxylate transporter permease [Desulfobacteraceae bacterium]
MEALSGLVYGFWNLLAPANLLSVFFGCLIGTVVGVLPGLGPVSTMALLLPFTLGTDPVTGLILLSGVFYGAQYGGSTTSILLNVPGEATSVMTCLDGYQMTKKNRAGAALTAAALGSWAAGTMGFLGLTFFAPQVAKVALDFGPPEYFAICLFALLILSNVSGGMPIRNMAMVCVGVMLATVGVDEVSGLSRFDYGTYALSQGIDFVPVLIGLFGMAEIIEMAVLEKEGAKSATKVRLRDMYPTKQEWRRMVPAVFRGGIIGFIVGLVPGPSGVLSTYASYAAEKKVSRHPEEFGRGAIEGVAGPESANNSAVAGGLIFLLTLGLPFTGFMAMLLAALNMHAIYPGPLFITQRPDIFWVFIASLYLGNLMLLVLNLPLVGFSAWFLRVPMRYLMPVVCLLCIVGTLTINNRLYDVWIMLAFGVGGFLMRRWKYEAAPLVLGLVLGPMLERSLTQSWVMFHGEFWRFWQRPISGVLMSLAILAPLFLWLLRLRRPRKGKVLG